MQLFSYGQPHVGDLAFAEYVSAQGENYRVTHTNDPAPRNGSSFSGGYVHIQPEYWIYEDRNDQLTVETDQIKVIYGFNSTDGNEVSE
jgi:predicted lipase